MNEQLSFLPEDYLERKAQRRTNVFCAVLAVIVMAAIGSAFSLTERMTRESERRHTQVEDQFAAAARQIDEFKQMELKQRKMTRQADLAASLLEKVPRSIVLAQIVNCAAPPADVAVEDLTLDSAKRQTQSAPQPKPTGPGADAFSEPLAEPVLYDVRLRVSGVATSDLQVAEYIRRLSQCPLFRDVNLVISQQAAQDDRTVRRFQIEMGLNNDVDVTALDIRSPDANATARLPAN
jgi:Tfp pilus assembly protein PilN